ncbi:MAG: PIN domain-containing protein [Spirochaetia bacterium]|nr:PIN domain-containing protein [Spirochaetia bacterium]
MITLIDTSAWIEALRKKGDRVTRDQVRSLLEGGDARTTEPILTEIWNGARGSEEIAFITDMENDIPLLKCNEPVFSLSWEIAKDCRKRGFTLPSIDIIIFSVASFYKANLLHRDTHFDTLASLQTSRKLHTGREY